MQHWKYQELLEAVQDTYNEELHTNRGYEYALARTFYEFETVCNEGKTEDIVVHTAIGQIVLKHPKISRDIVDILKKKLSSFHVTDIEHTLSSDEVKDLSNKTKKFLQKIPQIPIENNSNSTTH